VSGDHWTFRATDNVIKLARVAECWKYEHKNLAQFSLKAKLGTDVMITIFLRKKIAFFLQKKTMLWSTFCRIQQCFCFASKTPIFSPKIF
jgi:hypothetical protein